MVDEAKSGLRRQVQYLAEQQIASETVDMRQSADVRMNERLRELQESGRREYQEAAEKIAADYSRRMRDAGVQFEQPSENLRLKLAAVNARRGLFGGTIDAQTKSRANALTVELDQLEQRRKETMQALRSGEANELARLKDKHQSSVDAEMAKLRHESDTAIAEQTRERLDRLSADMSEGVSDDLPGAEKGVHRSGGNTVEQVRIASGKAESSAEMRFRMDLAAAQSSMRKRQEQMNRRQAEDHALVGRK
jgi:hypothetical protein